MVKENVDLLLRDDMHGGGNLLLLLPLAKAANKREHARLARIDRDRPRHQICAGVKMNLCLRHETVIGPERERHIARLPGPGLHHHAGGELGTAQGLAGHIHFTNQQRFPRGPLPRPHAEIERTVTLHRTGGHRVRNCLAGIEPIGQADDAAVAARRGILQQLIERIEEMSPGTDGGSIDGIFQIGGCFKRIGKAEIAEAGERFQRTRFGLFPDPQGRSQAGDTTRIGHRHAGGVIDEHREWAGILGGIIDAFHPRRSRQTEQQAEEEAAAQGDEDEPLARGESAQGVAVKPSRQPHATRREDDEQEPGQPRGEAQPTAELPFENAFGIHGFFGS